MLVGSVKKMPTPAASDPHLNGFILQDLQCGKILLDRALEIFLPQNGLNGAPAL